MLKKKKKLVNPDEWFMVLIFEFSIDLLGKILDKTIEKAKSPLCHGGETLEVGWGRTRVWK
jgi:hypothetical protein